MHKAIKSRRGYTLLELVITTPLMALLLAGMAASIGLVTRAMPTANTESSAALAIAAACEQLVSDLSYATTITSRSATSLQFACADRDGDGDTETVQYVWSGVAGAPWTRSLNGGTAQTLVPTVHQLTLSYNTRTDPVSGLLYLQSMDVSVTSPTAAARPLTLRFSCRNEPQLP